MQRPDRSGLRPAHDSKRRCDIVCIHNAPDTFKAALVDMWKNKSPSEAKGILRKPDVQVTNQGDKDLQLSKLGVIHDQVKSSMTDYLQA
jgi:hypothetical protein